MVVFDWSALAFYINEPPRSECASLKMIYVILSRDATGWTAASDKIFWKKSDKNRAGFLWLDSEAVEQAISRKQLFRRFRKIAKNDC